MMFIFMLSVVALLRITQGFKGPDFEHYVFKPVLFNVAHQPSTPEGPRPAYPSSFGFQVEAFGKNYSLELRRSDLLQSGYQELSDGTAADTTASTSWQDHCYYQGTIVEDFSGIVALDLCRGVTGTIMGHGEVLQIEPHGDEDLHEGSFSQQIPHRFYRTSALVTEPASNISFCGLNHGENHEHFDHPTDIFAPSPAPSPESEAPAPRAEKVQHVEVILVNDVARYQQHGANTEAKSLAILNLVNAFYQRGRFEERVASVKVVGQLTRKTSDPYTHPRIGGLVDSSGELSLFNSFLWQNKAAVPRHDVAVLMTGQPFASGVLGLASVGSACDDTLSGVVCSINSPTDSQNAIIVAHEIGHTFGMWHDGAGWNQCSATGDIMASYAGTGTGWSQCSLQYADAFFRTKAANCLEQHSD